MRGDVRRGDYAFSHRPVGRAKAFDQSPSTGAEGDESNDHKQPAEQLHSAAGRLCHKVKLGETSAFRKRFWRHLDVPVDSRKIANE